MKCPQDGLISKRRYILSYFSVLYLIYTLNIAN